MSSRKQLLKEILIAVAIVAFIFIIIILTCEIVKTSGKNKLYNEALSDNYVISSEIVETNSEIEVVEKDDSYAWQEGDIRYNGDIYRYNDKILTFLIMGIDKMEKVSDAPVNDHMTGGQADGLFLVALDTKNNKLNVIAINRNTIADVDVYDQSNEFLGTEKLQITLQHGYGDGKEESCERCVNTVSRFMHNLPIHGYLSLNMGAIPQINDAVGGVEVYIDEKIHDAPKSINDHFGQNVVLTGKDAYYYVHNRDIDEFGSANKRLSRQIRYLKAFADAAKKKTKERITFPIELYSAVKGYTVTDISLTEMGFLATQAASINFDSSNILSLQGETVMGEEFEEFYPDEDALVKLIIDVFYEKL